MASASHGIARTQRARTEEQRAQELVRIDKYRSVEAELSSGIAASSYDDDKLLQTTTKLLRLNPEHYTAWNVRRRCLTTSGSLSRPSAGSWPSKGSSSSCPSATTKTSSDASSPSSSAGTPNNQPLPTTGSHGTTSDGEGRQDAGNEKEAKIQKDAETIRSELLFTIPLLKSSPKCYWIWNHRRWVLSQAIQLLPAATGLARKIWEAELDLDTEMLRRDQRNFHAWGYRRYIVETLESDDLNGSSSNSSNSSSSNESKEQKKRRSMAEAEFAYTEKKIHENLSNFSAYHYRATLLPRILDERDSTDAERKNLLDQEINFVQDALNVGPEDQSLWFYHEHLMSHVLEPEEGEETTTTTTTTTTTIKSIVPALTDQDRILYLTDIIELIRDLLGDYRDVKFLYENLIRYTLALGKLRKQEGGKEGGGGGGGKDKEEIMAWLDKVRQLDPMREGRWQDVEKRIRASFSSSSS